MTLSFTLLITLLAGFLNGSYAAPFKSITWSNERIWLTFSLFTFAIMPWLSSFILDPHIFLLLSAIPSKLIVLLIGCGILFGLGIVTAKLKCPL